MKNKRKAYLHSLISLIICISMLIGTTFAWFTDNVNVSGNIIKAGNLDLELYWTDDLQGEWHNVEDEAYNTVFSYDNWEPGYTEVRYLKVKNNGNLAFNYQLTIDAQNSVGKLAEVINVYTANAAIAVNDREDLANLGAIGLLSNVMDGGAYASGTLLAEGQYSPLSDHHSGETVVTIAMSMITTAGNDYQGKSAGDFTISAVATQATFEEDSFGSNYDGGAEYPKILIPGKATAAVTPVDGKVPAGGVELVTSNVSAFVPEGTLLEDGADKLTLRVTPLEKSASDITVINNEILIPVDVHIDGVAENNTTPIIINLGEVMPKYLNLGNYTIVHVEDGVNKVMTLVDSASALTAHNTFTYDTNTGAVSVAMASFSEVAIVADTSAAWQSAVATEFSGGSGTAEDPYLIANADQFAYFNELISNDNENYGSKNYKLLSNININKQTFYPIGYHKVGGGVATIDLYDEAPSADYIIEEYTKLPAGTIAAEDYGVWYTYGGSFRGVFDGNGHTVSNFYQNTWSMIGDYDGHYWNDAMGLFGYVNGGTVKNLTVDSFTSDGEFTPTGVVAAYAANATFENIAIVNCNPRVYNTGNGGIVGIGGNTGDGSDKELVFRNITVDQSNKISALWGSWDVACGGLVGMFRGNGKVDFTNCHVAAQIDVNNDVCANYQYYWYRYSGMFIGSVRKNTTDANGYTVANTAGISATDCTYTYGAWNEYWYCELVANSLASYTHDHQFSRLTKIENESDIQDENGKWNKAGNFVIPAADKSYATCYHIFENANGEFYQHFHDVADESNPNVYENFDLNGNGKLDDLKEDRTCYYMPFGQLMNGDGYGVKPTYEFAEIAEREDGTVLSTRKFVLKEGAPTTYRPGATYKIGDLFKSTVDDSKLSTTSIFVAVSPATENDNVSATYAIDISDWKNGTITFAENSHGTARIVITDYFYCKPTVIHLEEKVSAQKFTAKDVGKKKAYTNIALGDLFEVVDGATLSGEIFVTATNEETKSTINVSDCNSDNWATKNIAFKEDGEWTVVIKDSDGYCAVTETTVMVEKADKIESNFTGDFLYRVGNQNNILLSALFGEKNTGVEVDNVNVSVITLNGNVETANISTASLGKSTIKFTGTGVVEVTISAPGANPVTVKLEVVDAYNVVKDGKINNYSTTSVLLGDTSVSTLYLNGNATLYGNGFTIDCTNSPINGSGSVSENYIISLVDAHLDNVKIVGKVYKDYGAQASNDYNRALVLCKGNSSITNCYLSNTASPIRLVEGNLEVKGTTVKGGNFANIDVRNGHLTLEDVTTINQALGNDKADGNTVIGLGIVVYYENVDTAVTSITINGTLTQYNNISSNDKFSHEYATQLVDAMMSSSYSKFQYESGGTTWVNPGIVAMTKIDEPVTTDQENAEDYIVEAVRFAAKDGYVYAAKPNSDSVIATPDEYTTLGQGLIAPKYSFDYTNKNYIAKTDGSNDYCYYDSGKVLIAMDQGDTFEWDPYILTATKNNQTLDYSVSMNGKTYSNGEKIVFNESGDFAVTYSYTDPYNYVFNANKELTGKSCTYTKTVNISVSVIKPAAQNATFTFADTNTATEKITVNNSTYISAKGVSDTDKEWGYIAVNGTKIFYPITEAQMKTSSKLLGGKETQVYYYVFKDAVTITDYKDGGTGGKQTYDSSTTTMPSNLTVVNGMEAKYTSISSACVDISKLIKKGSDGEVWDFSASTTVSGTTTYNNYLAHSSPSGLAVKDGTRDYDAITVAQFSYTDAAGATYYYFVGYFMPNQNTSDSGSGGGGCVTPDTLVTLADGTQKRIDEVTYADELLVWDFYKGEYTVMPSSIVMNHGEDIYKVVTLNFDDGTTVNTINGHGFFDADSKEYVILNDANADRYIGHDFVKVSGERYTTVKLVNYSVKTEYTESWSILTSSHYNCILEGMWTLTPAEVEGSPKYLMPYEIDDDMKYIKNAMDADIEKYGLYTYEDFADYMTYEQFVALGLENFKVSVAKGYITWEEILYLISIHIG